MTELQASRTLVKSPPELWAECSDAAALARHLGGFGEIRITRLDPETAVAWEGERARGTVRIEPAGWGTKVILTAEQLDEDLPPPGEPVEASTDPEPVEASTDPEPAVQRDPPPPPRRRFARLRAFFRGPEPAEPSPEPVEPPPELIAPAEPSPASEEPSPATEAEAALTAALDSLGQAHHRPYSRA
jgi:hypothetical protein